MTDKAITAASDVVREALEDPANRPVVKAFFDDDTNTVSYVVRDPNSRSATIIDSVLDYDAASGRTANSPAEAVIKYIRDEDLTVEWVLETHAHADHLSAAPFLQEKLGGRLAIGSDIQVVQDVFGKTFNAGSNFARDGSQFDQLFDDGDAFTIGGLDAVVIHTPGHTPACLAYVIGDAVFPGDTMFMPDAGTARCDFPGGDAATLYRSIRRLHQLPDEARVFVCHDYGTKDRPEIAWETTIGRERLENIHVREGVSEVEYVAVREARDATLAMPRLILPSIQVNMRAGHLPEPEADGRRYLKIPLDAL